MDQRIKHILSRYRTVTSADVDVNLKLGINSKERVLPPGDLNRVLDIPTQFNFERQNCPYYRVLGKISPLITNVLFNISEITVNNQLLSPGWETLSKPEFTTNILNNETISLNFEDSITKHLKELDGWYGFFDPVLRADKLCTYYEMEPKRERFSFIQDINNPKLQNIPVKNWELTITYPYSSDTKHALVNGGLLVIQKESVIVGGKQMTALVTPVFHNLSQGNLVRITGTTNDGDYTVTRVGLDDGSHKKYVFCLDIDPTLLTINQNSRMTKISNDAPCQYYFRIFKKVKTKNGLDIQNDDYEIFNLGFSKNIYQDDVSSFVFNEDINISGLTDNLNRPLSELYLTIVKTDSVGIFTKVSSGIETPFFSSLVNPNLLHILDIPVIQKIHNVNSWPVKTNTPLESDVKITDSTFYGDVVEYDLLNVQETILSDVNYRFNTIDRETTPDKNIKINFLKYKIHGLRPEGYYYKAHHLIKIRDYSNYVEESDENGDRPDYAVNLGDGRFLWRDLLEIGTNDVKEDFVNYPFLNNSHYCYDNYCFQVKRQDPFDTWNLYFSKFPADPIGNLMNQNFNVNVAENVC